MDGDGVPLGSYIPNESRRWKILAPILLWYLRDPCPVIEIRTHLVGISALFFRLRAFRFNPETPHQGLSEMEQEAINSTRFQYVSIPQTDTNDFCAGPFDILRPSQGQFSWPQSRLIGAGTHLQQNTRRTLSFFLPSMSSMYYVKVFLGFLQFYTNAAFIGPKLKPALLELETWQPSPPPLAPEFMMLLVHKYRLYRPQCVMLCDILKWYPIHFHPLSCEASMILSTSTLRRRYTELYTQKVHWGRFTAESPPILVMFQPFKMEISLSQYQTHPDFWLVESPFLVVNPPFLVDSVRSWWFRRPSHLRHLLTIWFHGEVSLLWWFPVAFSALLWICRLFHPWKVTWNPQDIPTVTGNWKMIFPLEPATCSVSGFVWK